MKAEYWRALKRKAKGYSVRERVSEYVAEEGGLTEVRRKVHTKHIPADLAALKLILELEGESDPARMTDEELRLEKARLLGLLAGSDQKEEERE